MALREKSNGHTHGWMDVCVYVGIMHVCMCRNLYIATATGLGASLQLS